MSIRISHVTVCVPAATLVVSVVSWPMLLPSALLAHTQRTHASLPHRPSITFPSSLLSSTQHLHLPRWRSCENKL